MVAPITQAADIYALGLMLNELFTGAVPHGTEYQLIAPLVPVYGFLDPIVAAMIRQNPGDRPGSIAKVKEMIQRHQAEAVSRQKLRELDRAVIPEGEIDDPLAYEPPKLIGAEYDRGVLRLRLDRPVNDKWVRALNNMGNYSSPMEAPPQAFCFEGSEAVVNVPGHVAQSAIDHFKVWLPKATSVLKYELEQEAERIKRERISELRREREIEERRLEINSTLRI